MEKGLTKYVRPIQWLVYAILMRTDEIYVFVMKKFLGP
jgi:hypothetical protein